MKRDAAYDSALRPVLDNPADDNARLVFADYLDDNGGADRAEFIRCQISSGELSYHWQYKFEKHGWRTDLDCRWASDLVIEFEKRTKEFPSFSWSACPSTLHPAAQTLYSCGAEWVRLIYRDCVEVVFRRGFVCEVRLDLRAFCGSRDVDSTWSGIAAELFRGQPVDRVVVLDAVPDLGYDGPEELWCSHRRTQRRRGPDTVPADLFRHLLRDYDYRANSPFREYDTREKALKDLVSAACRYGRAVALPPIPAAPEYVYTAADDSPLTPEEKT